MAMTNSARLERETEQTRAQVEQTLDELRSRMSPGNLLDQARAYLGNNEGRELLGNLRRQVVDNPLPITLVGAGLAWLAISSAMGRNGHAAAYRAGQSYRPGEYRVGDIDSSGAKMRSERRGNGQSNGTWRRAGHAVEDAGEGVGETVGAFAGEARETVEGWVEATKDVAGDAREAVHGTVRNLRDSASQVYEGTTDGARHAASRVAEYGRAARRAVEPNGALMNLMREQPILVAGLGLAIGAALGAMLPTTRAEGQVMGEASRAVRDKVKDVTDDGIAEAKKVGEEIYGEAKDKVTEAFHAGVDAASTGTQGDRGPDDWRAKAAQEGKPLQPPYAETPGPDEQRS